MSEDGFHEIQLNGKQLVFLFMAATVAAVVIFLCGVLVGRGVPAMRAAAPGTGEQQTIDPTAAAQAPPTTAEPADASSIAADLTYSKLLESPKPASETIPSAPDSAAPPPFDAARGRGDAAPAPAPPAAAESRATPAVAPRNAPAPRASEPSPVPTPAPEPAREEPAPAAPAVAASAVPDATLAEPPGNGFVVQVAAVRARSEAVVIAQRLGSKGYPVFVTTVGANMFRVRVGKYADRGAAEAVAGRLEREEQFKPWITR